MTAATIGALVVVLVLFFALLSIRLHVGLALMVSALAGVLILRGTDGSDAVVEQSQVKSMEVNPRSLMPDGLLVGLSEQQLRDFFAYLRIAQPIRN